MTHCKNCLPVNKETNPNNNKDISYGRPCNMFLNNSILDAKKFVTDLLPLPEKKHSNNLKETVKEIEKFLAEEDEKEYKIKKKESIMDKKEDNIINNKINNKIKVYKNNKEFDYLIKLLVIMVVLTLFNSLDSLFNLKDIFNFTKSKKKYSVLYQKLESFLGD